MDETAATIIPSTTTAASTERVERLVELVAALAGCHTEVARNAVQRSLERVPESQDESLAVVARALVSVRHGIDLRDQDQGAADPA